MYNFYIYIYIYIFFYVQIFVVTFYTHYFVYIHLLVKNVNILYISGLKLSSWRATALQSLAPTHTCLEASSDPEELD